MLGQLPLWAISAAIAMPFNAEAFDAKVVSILDGDTIRVLADGQQVTVRLAEIDAPEKAQPFGAKAKQSLSDMCFDKQARITTQGHDRYGRTVGRIYCFTPGVKVEIDANAEQVRRGMAWVFDRYATDKSLYRLQDDARIDHRGLWADQSPTPPWDWRKEKRKNK